MIALRRTGNDWLMELVMTRQVCYRVKNWGKNKSWNKEMAAQLRSFLDVVKSSFFLVFFFLNPCMRLTFRLQWPAAGGGGPGGGDRDGTDLHGAEERRAPTGSVRQRHNQVREPPSASSLLIHPPLSPLQYTLFSDLSAGSCTKCIPLHTCRIKNVFLWSVFVHLKTPRSI